MKDKKNIFCAVKTGAGRALITMSLLGMLPMSVSAANERELSEINSKVNVGSYQVNINAEGRIEYDKNEDGKKEVFYDFLDYRKLEKSLQTIDKNETALDKEYNRLYNLAEKNRKDIIESWNRRFYPNQQIPADGLYVSAEGTKSIKGAIDTMPVHTFDEIKLSFDNGKVNVNPNPLAWGYYKGGSVSTAEIEAQIASAFKHTETYVYPVGSHGDRADLVWESYTQEQINAMTQEQRNAVDASAIHKYRYVDATNVYNQGKEDGKREASAKVSSAIATARWMRDQQVSASLSKDTEYHIYAVNAGVNSHATNIRLKIKGADSWNIFNVEKTKLANGSDGTGFCGTFTDLPSGDNLNGKVKSLSYVTNTKNYVDIKIVPKKDITVTLAISSYDGYGVAFIE